VIVHEDHRRGILEDRGTEDLAGVNKRGVENPPRNHHIAENSMLSVEEECVEFLVWEIAETGGEEVVNVSRAPDPGPLGERFLGGTSPQLESSEEAGGICAAHPRNSLYVGGSGGKKRPEPTPR
jgi:hypothetical protein